jgi:hypothetical protein
MLLCSKGMVVSDKLKGLVKVQVSVKELNANEPLMKCRNGSSLLKV